MTKIVIENLVINDNLHSMRFLLAFIILFTVACHSRFTYEEAQRRGTIDAYYRFVLENPDAPEVEEALSKIKDTLFAAAIEKKDIVLIKRFISEFPNDPRSKTLSELLDEIRFEEAKRRNTRIAYDILRRIATNKKVREEASKLIYTIELNEVINTNDIEKLEGFLSKYPDNPHLKEINHRLMNIMFERIKAKDVFFAESFITRFPDTVKYNEVKNILITDLIEKLSNLCLLEGIDEYINSKYENNNTMIDYLYKQTKICQSKYDIFIKTTAGRLSKKEERDIFSQNINDYEKKQIKELITRYSNNIHNIQESLKKLNSENPIDRRNAYLSIEKFPLNVSFASEILKAFFSATLFERFEISEIIKTQLAEDINRRIYNFIFFASRDKHVYSITRNLFLEATSEFEKENVFLNKTFENTKEDILLQYLLIKRAYENGYNSFIKSNFNEYMKNILSLISEKQSMCQETCPQKILFDLKGSHLILTSIMDMARVIFGEKSEIYNILEAKNSEISNILARNRFSIEQPTIKTQVDKKDIEILKKIKGKSILIFIYKLEPDKEIRDIISKFIYSENHL
ncbi:MAG: hypothetical protein N2746_04265 [Deltaproteobacteria bacterium]|nr:hypothetical protein [Deltaproteobacteria bacterium]